MPSATQAPAPIPSHLKIAIVGGGGIGKSSITIRFVKPEETYKSGDFVPTIEETYIKKSYKVDDKTIEKLEVIDTAGQDEYKALRPFYMRNASGFLCVFDLTSPESLENLEEFASEIRITKDLDTFPCILVGNKSDLVDRRKVSAEEAKEFARKNFGQRCPYLETSALQGVGVEQAFQAVVREVLARPDLFPQEASSVTPSGKKGLFGSISASDDNEADLSNLSRY